MVKKEVIFHELERFIEDNISAFKKANKVKAFRNRIKEIELNGDTNLSYHLEALLYFVQFCDNSFGVYEQHIEKRNLKISESLFSDMYREFKIAFLN